MIQTSEYCAVGHPDRTCDYIASYLLDRWLEKDPFARVALEVQLKDKFCTVSGEVTSSWNFTDVEIGAFCREALWKIGYTKAYQEIFGAENVIASNDLEVTLHISRQSPDIAEGVDADGWGDQGIFFGLAVDSSETGNMPLDHWLARAIAIHLTGREAGGLDCKTQVTCVNGRPVEVVVAIPLTEKMKASHVTDIVRQFVGEGVKITVNGTGRYVRHGSIADCGTTGRKLVVDFYGGNSKIGGGSPWGKDPTKADVTLNIYARMLALEYMKEHSLPWVQCAISCCIGRREINVAFYGKDGDLLSSRTEDAPASHVIEKLGLRYPGYADRCAGGLFGHE